MMQWLHSLKMHDFSSTANRLLQATTESVNAKLESATIKLTETMASATQTMVSVTQTMASATPEEQTKETSNTLDNSSQSSIELNNL